MNKTSVAIRSLVLTRKIPQMVDVEDMKCVVQEV